MRASKRVLAVVLVTALLAAGPGCQQLIMLPVQIFETVVDVLFFWAAAPEASTGDADGPALAGAPLPLEDAVELALRSGATGQAWLVPAGGGLPAEASRPPFPGAVPRAIPVADGRRLPDLERTWEERGLVVIRTGDR